MIVVSKYLRDEAQQFDPYLFDCYKGSTCEHET